MTSIILCFNKHQLTRVHLENDRDDNWTIGVISRAKLQSNHHHQQTDIQFFTGWMPFLSPNQQCQSTEGKISHSMDLLTPSSPEGLPTLSPTTNSSWLPWRRVAMPLISPLMPVPQISSRKLKICIYTRRKIHWFPKCYSFRSAMKSNEFIAEKIVSEQWRHQALVDAWPSWIDARCQYVLLVLSCKDAEKVNYSS